jgi:LSD1 subclass zinc finger protein
MIVNKQFNGTINNQYKELVMANNAENLSSAETLRETRTFGKVRCHNPSCMERLEPSPGADHIKCATCGMEYRIYWVNPDLPRIRGPVWEVNRKIADEALKRKQESSGNNSRSKKGA